MLDQNSPLKNLNILMNDKLKAFLLMEDWEMFLCRIKFLLTVKTGLKVIKRPTSSCVSTLDPDWQLK